MNDVDIARKFLSKARHAKDSGVHFNLSFTSFKNVMRSKRCYYTGIELTVRSPESSILATDVTIDRVDNSKGYVKGNVVACCHAANRFKSVMEDPASVMDARLANRLIKKWSKHELNTK